MTDTKAERTRKKRAATRAANATVNATNSPTEKAARTPRKPRAKPVQPKAQSTRMSDRKPDNWEVHDTRTPADLAKGMEAAAKALQDGHDSNGAAKDLDEWLDESRDRDIVTTEVQPARAFRDQTFANANIGLISDYADYRVMGWNPERAFIRVFGTDYGDMHLFARIEALEHNLVYRQVFAKRFGATPLSRMFSVKHAIWHWLSLLNNPFVRETVRAKAIESLQVIYGITVVDEAGNTKATKTLDDFYREESANDPDESNPQAFRHPDPGSPEAIAFEDKMRGTSTGKNTAAA